MALPEFTMRQLLGSRRSLWSPDTALEPKDGTIHLRFSRNGIHIMDLTQTVPMLDAALNVVRETVAKGGRVSVRRHQASGAEPDCRCC